MSHLVEGIRWLQATFALRFNRFRYERGHVFQVRYKAIVTYLAALKKTERLAREEAKGAAWKVAVASAMKTETTASNPRLARRLIMGALSD